MKYDIQLETIKLQKSNSPEEVYKLVNARLKKIHYKLYQYCSFDASKNPFLTDKRYEKSNLYFKNVLVRQIYASRPSMFNDPFDCVIGASTQTILSAIVMSFLNSDYLQPRINRGEVKRILNGEINPEASMQMLIHRAPNLVNDIIMGILRNKDVQNRLKQANKKRITPAEVKVLYSQIFQDKVFVQSFVSHFVKPSYMNESTALRIQNLLISNSVLMSQILLGPAKMDFDENGKIVNFNLEIDKLENIASQEGYDVSKDTELLKENLGTAYSIAQKGLSEFYKSIDEQFGVTCFSEKSNIPLMWSHYANKHSGFVIEYDLSNLSIEDAEKIGFLYKVKYSKFRPSLDNRLLEEVDIVHKNFDLKDTMLGSMISAIFTKSSVWKYEREWRNIMLVKYTSDRKIPFPYISRIILGVRTPNKALKHFKKLHDLTGIPIDRYKLDDDSFTLVNFTNAISESYLKGGDNGEN